jgi:hypothetical protein
MIAANMGRAPYSRQIQQPVRATAIPGSRPHTCRAAQLGSDRRLPAREIIRALGGSKLPSWPQGWQSSYEPG